MTRAVAALTVLLGALTIALPTHALGDDDARIVLKTGLEHDTNARRIVGTERAPDQLLRAFIKSDLDYGIGPVGRLEAKVLLGAKFMRQIADEDAFVTSADLTWRKTLFATELFGLATWVRGDFGDRSERSSTRDYMRAGVSAGLSARLGPVGLSSGGGYRAFIYKPDLDSNHRGPTANASVSVDIGWGLSSFVSYRYIERDFDVPRFVEAGELVAEDPDTLREDALHLGRVGLSYRGLFLLSAHYGLQINRSNSFGPGLVRHIGELTWTQPLPLDILFDVTGRIQRTAFDDPVRIDETLSIDEDNRNMVVAGLAVPVPGTDNILSGELRYSLFTEALGDDGDYIRHLFYFGLSADLDLLGSDAP